MRNPNLTIESNGCELLVMSDGEYIESIDVNLIGDDDFGGGEPTGNRHVVIESVTLGGVDVDKVRIFSKSFLAEIMEEAQNICDKHN